MRFLRVCAAALLMVFLCAVEAVPGWAQSRGTRLSTERLRPTFDPALTPGKLLAGTVRLTLVGRTDGPQRFRASIGTGGWCVNAHLDDVSLGTFAQLPTVVDCDTRRVLDGAHALSLALINTQTDQKIVVETVPVTIDNATADALAASAAARTVAVPPPTETGPPRFERGGGTVVPAPAALVPTEAHLTPVKATVSASPNPRLASATTLLRAGNRLYLGLSDGSLAFCAASSNDKRGTVIHLPFASGAVRCLAVGGGNVWWVTGGNDPGIFAYHDADRTVTRCDLMVAPDPSLPTVTQSQSAAGWIQRVVVLRGQPLLIGAGGAVRLVDTKTGVLTDPLAGENGSLLPATPLCLCSGGDGKEARTLLVSVDPSGRGRPRLHTYQAGADGAWKPVGEAETSLDLRWTVAADARFALSPYGIATLEGDGVRVLLTDASGREAAPQDVKFTRAPGIPWLAERVALGGSGVWWSSRGLVFHADPATGARDAYLPWNLPNSGEIQALLADHDGVWVATAAKGVRYLQPGKPSPRDGYNGFVRARLGDETATVTTNRDRAISASIDAWQGVPYLWGGGSKSGTDCSGFVGAMHRVAGVSIPRTTAEMGVSRQGKRVLDEIHWGDTLVFPGHCALYVGDGKTAETVGGSAGGSVSHASIWSRSTVVVRRFLP